MEGDIYGVLILVVIVVGWVGFMAYEWRRAVGEVRRDDR